MRYSDNLLRPLIKKSRLKLGLTREQLCNRASEHGVNILPATLERIENQQQTLPDGMLYALLQVLGVTLGEIEREFARISEELEQK